MHVKILFHAGQKIYYILLIKTIIIIFRAFIAISNKVFYINAKSLLESIDVKQQLSPYVWHRFCIFVFTI